MAQNLDPKWRPGWPVSRRGPLEKASSGTTPSPIYAFFFSHAFPSPIHAFLFSPRGGQAPGYRPDLTSRQLLRRSTFATPLFSHCCHCLRLERLHPSMRAPTQSDVHHRKRIFPSLPFCKAQPCKGFWPLAEFLALAKCVEMVAEAVTTPASAANQIAILKVVAASPATQKNDPGA